MLGVSSIVSKNTGMGSSVFGSAVAVSVSLITPGQHTVLPSALGIPGAAMQAYIVVVKSLLS